MTSVDEDKVKLTGFRPIRQRHLRRPEVELERICTDVVLGAIRFYNIRFARIGNNGQMITSPCREENG